MANVNANSVFEIFTVPQAKWAYNTPSHEKQENSWFTRSYLWIQYKSNRNPYQNKYSTNPSSYYTCSMQPQVACVVEVHGRGRSR